jgi:hypothetical protein
MEVQRKQINKVGEHQQPNKVSERQQSMKNKKNSCENERKEYGKGKKGKGYVEIQIKMDRGSKMPKKSTKRK